MIQQERSNSRYTRRNAEEDRAWFHLYRDAHQASVAHEVIQLLDADPEIKRCHTALYLRCRQTVRAHKARQARNQRVGAFVRGALALMFLGPLRALRALASQSGELAVEILPEVRQEPAMSQVRRIRKTPEFAKASAEFREPTASGAPVDKKERASRDAKAA